LPRRLHRATRCRVVQRAAAGGTLRCRGRPGGGGGGRWRWPRCDAMRCDQRGAQFPALTFTLNGGVNSLDEVLEHRRVPPAPYQPPSACSCGGYIHLGMRGAVQTACGRARGASMLRASTAAAAGDTGAQGRHARPRCNQQPVAVRRCGSRAPAPLDPAPAAPSPAPAPIPPPPPSLAQSLCQSLAAPCP
jgi:hypothetical protein